MKNRKENLWNTSKNKTRKVIRFIENLEPNDSFDIKQIKKFNEIKAKALMQTTPNAMLRVIGYKAKGIAEIYDLNEGKDFE